MSDSPDARFLAALAEFAAGAGHEINNPLAVISGRAQLLLRGETDPERRRDLALINSQAMRVTEMIADLRLFAAGPELHCEPVNVAALVCGIVESMRPGAEEQETQLVLRTVGAEQGAGSREQGAGSREQGVGSREQGAGNKVNADAAFALSADPVQLAVAVRALIQNALESLAHRGRIEISVAAASDELRISVADDGPGIAAEHRPHIFEPFYSARQAGRGIGMGLPKCWRIATAHGGRVEVESQPGCGAVFTIYLPRSLCTPTDISDDRAQQSSRSASQ